MDARGDSTGHSKRARAAVGPAGRSVEGVESSLPRAVHRWGVRLPRRAQWLASQSSPEALYRDCVSFWTSSRTAGRSRPEALSVLTDPTQWARLPHILERAMFMDLVGYLPDDILVKVDRAAMAVG